MSMVRHCRTVTVERNVFFKGCGMDEPKRYKSCQLVITLVDSEPEIWREVVVPRAIALKDLHSVIQQAMGWKNQHSYQFTAGIGLAAYALQHSLDSIFPGAPLYYTYDFKSGWLHRIEIVHGIADEIADEIAQPTDTPNIGCVNGAMACPPEGTGGVWGYDEFLDRLEDPEDPDYLALIGQYGDFQPEQFDVSAANARVCSLRQELIGQAGN